MLKALAQQEPRCTASIVSRRDRRTEYRCTAEKGHAGPHRCICCNTRWTDAGLAHDGDRPVEHEKVLGHAPAPPPTKTVGPGWRDRDHTSHLDLRAVGGNGAFASVAPFLDKTLEPQWKVRVGLRAAPGATRDDAKRLAELATAALVAAGVFTAPPPAWIEDAPPGDGIIATIGGPPPTMVLCACVTGGDRSTARGDCQACEGTGEHEDIPW